MAHGLLIHADRDQVGVAVRDLKPGETVTGVYQLSLQETRITVRDAVPLGHKVALRELQTGDTVIEYGEVIGVATQPIAAGEHVHVHNIKSVRWG
ncbi:MAG: UxaA family hydrolase [Thermaerobacter sp.]|nr:UxaA family hydrolase [Thermaerobacter sp.]